MLNPFSSSQFHLHIRSFGIRGRERGGGREAGREKVAWEGCLDGVVLHDLIVVKLPRISAAVFG